MSDWYFWVPLYSCAAYVNLINSLASSVPTKRVSVTGKITLYLGIFLLTKVVLEDYFGDMVGIWSLDMRHRLVREKFGSGLVISSMILQLLSLEEDPTKRGNFTVRPHVESGKYTIHLLCTKFCKDRLVNWVMLLCRDGNFGRDQLWTLLCLYGSSWKRDDVLIYPAIQDCVPDLRKWWFP